MPYNVPERFSGFAFGSDEAVGDMEAALGRRGDPKTNGDTLFVGSGLEGEEVGLVFSVSLKP